MNDQTPMEQSGSPSQHEDLIPLADGDEGAASAEAAGSPDQRSAFTNAVTAGAGDGRAKADAAERAEPTTAGSAESEFQLRRGRIDEGDGWRTKLLSVHLGENEYAFPLSEIRRIIPAEGMELDPIAPNAVVGAMTVDEERLGVIDLHRRLGLDEVDQERIEQGLGCIMIIEYGDVAVGYLIDAVGSLFDVEHSEIRSSEFVGGLSQSNKQTMGFIEVNDKPMEVLSFQGMLTESELSAIRNWRGTMNRVLQMALAQQRAKQAEEAKEENPLAEFAGSYLVVRVGTALMGIPTTEIAEVLPKESLVSMPLTREDFSGVLLLRGVTHPVLDLREHFDLELTGNEDAMRTAIVLVKDGENRVGLLVQEVVQLSVLETRQIQNRDECRLDVHPHLIQACANLDIGQAGLLNVSEILRDEGPSLRRNWQNAQEQMRRHEQKAA